jgi:hypothetical protein
MVRTERNGSGSRSVFGFGICGVETSGSVARHLVTIKALNYYIMVGGISVSTCLIKCANFCKCVEAAHVESL